MSDATRDDRLVEGLLAFDTLAEAAKAAQVPYTSARRRLMDPGFQEALRLARGQVYDAALTRVQGLAEKAVTVLKRALDRDDVSVARWVLERGGDAYLVDLTKRLERLEGQTQ